MVLYIPRASIFIVSQTESKPSVIPLTRPNTINPPNVIKSLDGECILRSLQNASIIALPRLIIAAIALENAARMPIERPFVMLPPNAIKSFAGDSIPRRLQKASTIDLPRFIIAVTALEAPE